MLRKCTNLLILQISLIAGVAWSQVAAPVAQVTQTTVTSVVSGSPVAATATITTTTATSAVPAAATPIYGNYYDVTARSLTADGTISPQAVRFMLSPGAPGTTASTVMQLVLSPGLASQALFINRSDLPAALQLGPLAEMEMLFVPLGSENFQSDFALDLLRPDGTFFGHTMQFTGPTAEPLTGFGIIYESVISSTSSPTTGTAVTYAGGNILVPNSNLNATTDLPEFSVLIVDPSNSQAYRLDSLGVHVTQKQARDADGIIQVKAPYLSDTATSSPRLQRFSGQLIGSAGQPIASQPFTLNPPYEALLHISQFSDVPAFYTGTDGRFSLVFDTMGYFAERKAVRSWSPLALQTWLGTEQQFTIEADQQNVFRLTGQ